MIKTAESVRAGHTDKLCDYIADSILDEALDGDPCSSDSCGSTGDESQDLCG